MSLRAPVGPTRPVRAGHPSRAAKASRLPRRGLLAVACVAGGALALPLGAGASPAAATIGLASLAPSADAGSDAVALLETAYQQSRLRTYHGVQRVLVGGETHQVDVSHVPGHTYLYAEGSQTAYEANDGVAATSSDDQLAKDPLSLLKQHYQLSVARHDSLLGRPAVVIQAAAQDGRVAAEFWVDSVSRLLVRRETFVGQHNLYSDVQYTSLVVGAADPELRTVTATPLAPTGTNDATASLAQLHSRGWWASSELPGGLSLYDAREVRSAGGTVLHLSYSDGISTVSVFEQRGRLAGDRQGSAALPAGWHTLAMRDGRQVILADDTPVRAAWQAHDLVLAVIADVPTDQVMPVIEALPAGPAPSTRGGVTARIGRGLGRIGSGLSRLNPFG